MVKYQSNLPEVKSSLKSSIEGALMAIGGFVEGETKVRSAVDTGNLRDSWSHRTEETSVTIGTNVEYAEYVEKGTSKSAAQPALLPAIESNTGRIQELVKGAWRM